MLFNFFCRHKAFLIIEKRADLKETKKLFLQKIQLLLKQYSNTKKSIMESEGIDEPFKLPFSFLVNLTIKRLEAIQFLIECNDVTWNILQRYVDPKKNRYFVGTPKMSMDVIELDIIGKFSESFFFTLRRLGIISHKDWDDIALLKISRSFFSISHLNDYVVSDFISPPDRYVQLKAELNSRYTSFLSSLDRKLRFNSLEGYVWNFLSKIQDDNIFNFLTKTVEDHDFIFAHLDQYMYQLLLKPNADAVKEDIGNIDLGLLKNIYEQFSKLLRFATTLDRLRNIMIEIEVFNKPAANKLFVVIFIAFIKDGNFGELRREDGMSDRQYGVYKAFFGLDLLRFLVESGFDFAEFLDKAMDITITDLFTYLFSHVFNKTYIQQYLTVVDFVSVEIIRGLAHSLTSNPGWDKEYQKRFSGYFASLQ